MSEGRVFLIRHGRTPGNVARRRVGRQDLPLDEVGEEQARLVAEALRETPVHRVWVSSLGRAQATAAPLCALWSVTPVVTDDLVEMDYGEESGTERGGGRAPVRHHRVEPYPGGESLRDVWARVDRVAGAIEEALRDGPTVAVVGHYRSNQLLAGRLVGLGFDDAVDEAFHRPANGSVHEVIRDAAPGGPYERLVWQPPD